MDLKKKYLYQVITGYRKCQNSELLDLEKLCVSLDCHILIEDEKSMFPTNEVAYYILYQDGKSCIVIHSCIDTIYHKEIIVYSLLRMELIKKYSKEIKVERFTNGAIMESFFSSRSNQSCKICESMMREVLLPSSVLSVSLYQTLNAKKLEHIASNFSLRPQLVLDKYKEVSNSAKDLLHGIQVRTDYQSSILTRFLQN